MNMLHLTPDDLVQDKPAPSLPVTHPMPAAPRPQATSATEAGASTSTDGSDKYAIGLSLFQKIMVLVFLLVIICVSATTYFAVVTQSKALKEGLVHSGRLMAHNIASSTANAFWSLNWLFVEKQLQDPKLYATEDIVFAKIIDPQGQVYLANDRAYYGETFETDLLTEEERILFDYPFPQQEAPGILIIDPVPIGKERWHVAIGLSMTPIQKALDRVIYRNAGIGLLILAPLLLVAYGFARTLTRPLARLSEASHAIAQGRYDHSLEAMPRDEIGQLGHAFTHMSASLATAQQALRQSNELFLTVLDSIVADIYVADMDTHEVLFMNRTMRDCFGADKTGELCYRVFRGSAEPCKHCTNPLLVDAAGKPAGIHEWECRNPLTGIYYVNYDRAIQWVDGRIVRLQIAMDVTKRKKAQDALKQMNDELENLVAARTREIERTNQDLRVEIQERQNATEALEVAKAAAERANQSKSEFLANMSHELRTPLNHIIGFTELVAYKNFGELNSAQEEYLLDVLNSGRHLLSLINDILDLSKVEAGKHELQLSEVDPGQLLADSLTMIKEKSFKHGIHIINQADTLPDTVAFDQRKIKQILFNLLSNAVKFTPDGGQITVEAHLEHLGGPRRQLKFSVADTGIGLARDDLQRIFSPFEQVENSTSRQFQGTGLGLALTKQFVELHGGQIWVESPGPGHGSTFIFTIPCNTD